MNRSEIFGNGFLRLNNALCSVLGLEKAAMLSLINEQIECSEIIRDYMKEHQGFFFLTLENVESRFGMSPYRQANIMKELEAEGLIEVRIMGSPINHRHVKLNEMALTRICQEYASRKETINTKKAVAAKSREDFYEILNASIWAGFDAYKSSIGNIDPRMALPIYIFTRLLKHYHNITFTWDTQRYGQFKAILRIYKKDMDYARLDRILNNEVFKSTDYILNTFKELNKSTAELDPSNRKHNPTELPCWNDIITEVSL